MSPAVAAAVMATPPLPTVSRYMLPDAVKFSVVALTSISAALTPTNVAALTVNTSAVTSTTSSCALVISVIVPAELMVTSPKVAALTAPNDTTPLETVVNVTSSLFAPPKAAASVATMLLA